MFDDNVDRCHNVFICPGFHFYPDCCPEGNQFCDIFGGNAETTRSDIPSGISKLKSLIKLEMFNGVT